MPVQDIGIDWLEKRIWLPAQRAQTYITGAGVAAGDPLFQEISTFGLTGIALAADGDAIAYLEQAPYDLDTRHQVRVRVIWSTSSTDVDTPLFTVTYSALASAAAIVAPATALTTDIVASTAPGAANTIEATSWGIIAKNTISDTALWLNWLVTCTTISGSANELSLLGLEIRYSPRKTLGPPKTRGGWRLSATRPLSRLLHGTQEAT